MTKLQKNKLITISSTVLRSICVLCATGTLLQTFLAYVGFSAEQIYLHATLVNAVNVMTIVLCSHFADGKRLFVRNAIVQIPHGLLFLFLLPYCFQAEATTTAFVLLTCTSLAQSICTALQTVTGYKVPYFAYRAQDYGPLEAVVGILTAAITFATGELVHFLQQNMPFDRVMFYAFILAAIFMVASGVLCFFYTAISRKEFRGEEITEEEEKEEPKVDEVSSKSVSIFELFRRPIFYLLVPANLLRGFATGTVTVFATIALSLGYNAETTTRMVSLSAIAHLAACFLFGIASRYLSPRVSILVGSLTYLLTPLCLMNSAPMFLLAYVIIFCGKAIVDVGVPSLMVQSVDVELAGPFNAWRMILHTGGMMLATSVAPLLSPTVLLFITLVCGALSGILFFSLRILRKASPTFLRGRPHLLRRVKPGKH